MKALLEAIFKVPVPQPLQSIEALKPTGKPNQARLLPSGQDAGVVSIPKTVLLQGSAYALSPDALFKAACTSLEQGMAAIPLGEEPERNMAVYCVRTPLMRYPDLVYLEAKDLSSGDTARSTLAAYSHSLYGRSDLGANAKRLRALIEALQSHQIDEKFA